MILNWPPFTESTSQSEFQRVVQSFPIRIFFFWGGGGGIENRKPFFFRQWCTALNCAILSVAYKIHIYSCSPCFCRVIETIMKRTEKSGGNTRTSARVPTAFLVLPNFLSRFYNSIETRNIFSSLFLK